jgi:Tfp pilus assembly protein PilF
MREADQTVLRNAVETSFDALRREIGADDQSPGRRAYERSRRLLERWRAQYPAQLPPVSEAEVETVAADLELSSGNLREAEGHLTRATQATPAARDAFYLLAEIAWRHHDGAEATRRLRAGLALPLGANESDSFFRPQFSVRLGLAARVAGNADESRRLLQEAGAALDALARASADRELAMVQLQRAVVADALGEPERARAALRAALDADGDSQEVAARAITSSLAHGRWADARDFSRTARAQLTLDRNWQTYFALWGVIAARVGHLDDDGGAGRALEALTPQESSASWTGRLAQRYTGAIDRARLVGYARTTGQRAEALFYDAMLKRAAGDASADDDLRAVLATEVMRYWEFEMAWEMLEGRAP